MYMRICSLPSHLGDHRRSQRTVTVYAENADKVNGWIAQNAVVKK